MVCCCLQETHIKELNNINIRDSLSGEIYNVQTFKTINGHHGIGFATLSHIECTYKQLHDHIAVAYLNINENNNEKKRKIRIFNIYAPPKCRSKKYYEEIDQIYDILESELNKESVIHTFICGDLNISLAGEHSKYPRHIGKYGKGQNSFGSERIIEILERHDFYVTNTFFNHKLAHITTWEYEFVPKNRRNPSRTQIDYIIANRKWLSNNISARSYNNIKTYADHRLVISEFKIN